MGAGLPPDVELRALGVVEIVSFAARLCRMHAWTLLKVVAPVVVPVQILGALILALIPDESEVFIETPSRLRFTRPELVVDATALRMFLVGKSAVLLLTVIAIQFATAASVGALSYAYIGSPPRWRRSLSRALRRLRRLARLTGLWIVLVGAGSLAGVIPGVWLYVSWAVAVPVLIVERKQSSSAVLRRSLRLVRGRWWAVLGVLALSRLIASVLGGTIRSLLRTVEAVVGDGAVATFALDALGSVTAETLVTPFLAATVVILYYDLRLRKDRLDLGRLARQIGVKAAPQTTKSNEPDRQSSTPKGGG